MKRFHWPLQRLFDVTVQRERALRQELLDLAREAATVRQRLLHRRVVLRMELDRLAEEQPSRRLARQELFMNCAAAAAAPLRALQAQWASLERRREEVMRRFVATRTSRQTLERRREEARQAHLREQDKLEQRQFDEGAHVAFARRVIRARVADAG